MMSQKFKSHFSFAAVAMLGGLVLMAGCEKENQNVSDIPEGALGISTEGVHSDAKTTVSGVSVLWQNDDRVNFNGVEKSVVVDGSGRAYLSNVENSKSMYAAFPYDIADVDVTGADTTITLNMPSTYVYQEVDGRQKVDLPMVAYAEGGSFNIEFKHVTSTLKVVVRNVSTSIPNPAAFYLDTISVKSTAAICGEVTIDATTNPISIVGSRPAVSGNDEVTMTFASDTYSVPVDGEKEIQVPVLFNDGTSDIIVRVVGHYANSIDLGTGRIDAAAEVDYSNRADYVTLPRAYVIPATCSIHPYNTAVTMKYHKFKVADNRWVYFSHGNLQYNPSSMSWKMAATQRDFIGAGNSNITNSSYDGWIDLFGWGTKTNPTNTSTTDGDYTWGEWGQNSIPDTYGTWRTLTNAECIYLIDTRTTGGEVAGTSNAKFTLARVNGIYGVILFPDEFEAPTLTDANSAWGTGYINNKDPRDENGEPTWGAIVGGMNDWQKLERAGCVFLPAAGIRSTSLEGLGSNGSYWLKDDAGENKAYRIYFRSGVFTRNQFERHYGGSVRLVQTAN